MNKKALGIGIIAVLIVGGLVWYFIRDQQKPTNLSNIFEVEDAHIPAFLDFVAPLGLYAHKIVGVDAATESLVVRDGLGHEFTLTFDFADFHLREHHRNVAPLIDQMGLAGFLEFAMDNNLYQHEIGPVTPRDQVVLIYGDRGTDYATKFFMTFDNIINHIERDHKWTNQELLDAGYCESVFTGGDVATCIQKLTYGE